MDPGPPVGSNGKRFCPALTWFTWKRWGAQRIAIRVTMPGYVAPAPIPAYTRSFSLAAGGAALTAPVIGGNPNVALFLTGPVAYAPPEERGWKDTVKMNPGEVTRILVRFSPNDNTAAFPFDATAEPGYVWHCHILDHEDNEMMRPYKVQP